MGGSSRPRPLSVAPAPPAAGETIAGKYRFERIIGEGAMGTVIVAHHMLLDVTVAVKLLSPELVLRQDIVERFLREARAAARLKSEHVARVMDVGTLETGQPFIVMELLEGEDLENRLTRLGRIPLAEAVDCVLQALDAIAQAHAAGIVHRDLKPANLFVALMPDGGEIVKVLDFGIAKLIDVRAIDRDGKHAGAITGEQVALGSPSYMSPEQVRNSSKIDHRADLWALGTILYELVTGGPAFDGQSVGEVFGEILHSPPKPIPTSLAEASPALGPVIARCLERDPEKRWADAAQLARALAPLGTGDFTGYCERIEHTLARGKTSDPGASAPSVRRPHMRAHSSGSNRMAHASTETTLGASQPAAPRRGPSVGIKALSAAALLGLLAGLVILYAAVHARGQLSDVPSMPAPPSVAASVAAPSPVSPAPPATAPPSASTPSASAVASQSAAASSPLARPQGGRARPAPAPLVPKRGANCNPNYAYDADGNKVFKPECFEP